MPSYSMRNHRVPYEEQIAKKHKLGFRYLNTLRKKSIPFLRTVKKARNKLHGQIACKRKEKLLLIVCT